jgi:hypothetical protein
MNGLNGFETKADMGVCMPSVMARSVDATEYDRPGISRRFRKFRQLICVIRAISGSSSRFQCKSEQAPI